jgi:hypothetical protein
MVMKMLVLVFWAVTPHALVSDFGGMLVTTYNTRPHSIITWKTDIDTFWSPPTILFPEIKEQDDKRSVYLEQHKDQP